MKDFMKGIFGLVSIFMVCMLLVMLIGLAVTAFADNGVSTGNRTYSTLTSETVATGVTVTSSIYTFDNPMNSVACDIWMSSATATGTFSLEGTAGTNTTSMVSGNMVSSQTMTAGTLNTVWSTGKPVRRIRTRYGLASTSSVTTKVNVNCFGVQ